MLVALAAVLAALTACGPARADSPYLSPFGDQPYELGRTDMGVDFCLTPGEPIRAVGDALVVGVEHDWFEGEPYLWYELLDGPDAGRFVYVAEQITHLARPGETVKAGDVVAHYARTGSCIETGWSEADGATVAAATTGYTEGQVTDAGVSFARFLISVGVQGEFELTPSATAARAADKAHAHAKRMHRKAKRKATPPKPASPPPIIVGSVPLTPPS